MDEEHFPVRESSEVHPTGPAHDQHPRIDEHRPADCHRRRCEPHLPLPECQEVRDDVRPSRVPHPNPEGADHEATAAGPVPRLSRPALHRDRLHARDEPDRASHRNENRKRHQERGHAHGQSPECVGQ